MVSGERSIWLSQGELLARAGELLESAEGDPVVRLPAEFVMLSRVFGVLGGLFHHYRPRIDYARHLAPVLGSPSDRRGESTREPDGELRPDAWRDAWRG